SNTVWNLVHSVVSAVAGIVVSALTARYLGTTEFGVLSYIVWLTGIVATITDLGLDQVIRKYVPGWFHRADQRSWALRVVGRAIALQLAMAGTLIAGLLALFPWWSRSLTIAHTRLEMVMAIGLVSVLPVVVSRCVSTFLRSIQSTRDLAMVTIATQATNLALVATAVALRLPLVALVTVGVTAQLLVAACLTIWFFMDSIVPLLYGSAYQTVARVFPFVLFGMVVATISNPIAIKIHLSNRKFAGTLGIGLVGAVINITLDLLLIPAHH